jgi:hypothetical protein
MFGDCRRHSQERRALARRGAVTKGIQESLVTFSGSVTTRPRAAGVSLPGSFVRVTHGVLR